MLCKILTKPHQLANRLHCRKESTKTAVFLWGNGSKGQLGVGNINKTKLLSAEAEFVQQQPRQLSKSRHFKKLAIGQHFTLAVCNAGGLWGWGTGFLRKPKSEGSGWMSSFIGGESSHMMSNEPVPILSGKNIVNVAAGYDHGAAIDSAGLLYTWGKNKQGGALLSSQGGLLGHGDYEDVVQPKLVEMIPKTNQNSNYYISCFSQDLRILE